jgi:hypothetical protein
LEAHRLRTPGVAGSSPASQTRWRPSGGRRPRDRRGGPEPAGAAAPGRDSPPGLRSLDGRFDSGWGDWPMTVIGERTGLLPRASRFESGWADLTPREHGGHAPVSYSGDRRFESDSRLCVGLRPDAPTSQCACIAARAAPRGRRADICRTAGRRRSVIWRHSRFDSGCGPLEGRCSDRNNSSARPNPRTPASEAGGPPARGLRRGSKRIGYRYASLIPMRGNSPAPIHPRRPGAVASIHTRPGGELWTTRSTS